MAPSVSFCRCLGIYSFFLFCKYHGTVFNLVKISQTGPGGRTLITHVADRRRKTKRFLGVTAQLLGTRKLKRHFKKQTN